MDRAEKAKAFWSLFYPGLLSAIEGLGEGAFSGFRLDLRSKGVGLAYVELHVAYKISADQHVLELVVSSIGRVTNNRHRPGE